MGQSLKIKKHDVIADVKEAVYDIVEESGQIDAKVVAQKVFKDNVSAQVAFQEEVVEKGYVDQAPLLREVREITEKKIWQTKIKIIEWN